MLLHDSAILCSSSRLVVASPLTFAQMMISVSFFFGGGGTAIVFFLGCTIVHPWCFSRVFFCGAAAG